MAKEVQSSLENELSTCTEPNALHDLLERIDERFGAHFGTPIAQGLFAIATNELIDPSEVQTANQKRAFEMLQCSKEAGVLGALDAVLSLPIQEVTTRQLDTLCNLLVENSFVIPPRQEVQLRKLLVQLIPGASEELSESAASLSRSMDRVFWSAQSIARDI